jgi:hypothetical protein
VASELGSDALLGSKTSHRDYGGQYPPDLRVAGGSGGEWVGE